MVEGIKYLKYAQLANGLGVQQATINVGVGRGHLIACTVEGKKMIDITDPTNILWLKKQEDEGKEFDLNAAFKKQATNQPRKTQPPKNKELKTKQPQKDKEPEDPEFAELRDIQLAIKKATLKRTQKAIELDEIKIAKQLGQLIPFDAVKSFFLYVVETFSKSYDQESKTIADLVLSRFGADQEDFIETRKDLSKKISDIKSDVIEQLLKGLDQIVEEYQETRSRGESK